MLRRSSVIRTRLATSARALVLALLFAEAVFCFQTVYARPPYLDDAFITFRIAENFAEGRGPYFNAGENIQGSSSPLYTILLAALAVVTGASVTTVETVVGIVALFGLCLFLYLLGRGLPVFGRGAILIPFLLLLNTHEIAHVRGMESVLYAALMVAAAWGETRRSSATTGASLGLFTVARPEGALLVVSYLACWIAGRIWIGRAAFPWRPLSRTLGIALLAALPFLGYALLYFGSPLPDTIAGKLLQNGDSFKPFTHRAYAFLFTDGAFNTYSLWGVLSIAGLMFAAFRVAQERCIDPRHLQSLGPMTLFTVLYVVLFALAGAPDYPWYIFPLVVTCMPYAALSALALWRIAWGADPLPGLTPKPAARAPFRLRVLSGVALLMLLAGGTYWRAVHVLHVSYHLRHSTPAFLSDLGYAATGRWMKAAAQGRPWTFSSVEIGILGYWSELHCIDLAGLLTIEAREHFLKEPATRTALRFRPEIHVSTRRPELIPGSRAYSPKLAASFDETYRAAEIYRPCPTRVIWIYVRRDLSLPANIPPPEAFED